MTLISNPTEDQPNHLDRDLKRGLRVNWEVLAYVLLIVAALFTRFYILGERVQSHDESLHTRFSYDLYAEGNFQHTPMMHGPVLFHATAFAYYLFGDNDFSARIYPALLGVLMVLSPLLFRRWLGRWGALIASVLLLISPLILYYNRYIRHDTPSMLFAITMMWAILMYLNGPPHQRRRAHWLYIIAASMILNLGSKETAFIYIAIFGIFLALYWFVRLAQYFWDVPGKTIFRFLMLGILFGGTLSLGMYIILDIIQFDLIPSEGSVSFFSLPMAEQQTYFLWTFAAIVTVLTVMLLTMFWAYRKNPGQIKWPEVAALLGIALAVCFALVVFEEVSHTTPTSDEPTAPVVPGEGGEGAASLTGLSWTPMIAVWAASLGGILFLLLATVTREDFRNLERRTPGAVLGLYRRGIARRFGSGDPEGDHKDKAGRGFWGTLDLFPEVDVMIVIATLILPWATAFVPYFMSGTSADFVAIAQGLPEGLNNVLMNLPQVNSPQMVGQIVISGMAFLPLMLLSIVVGLMWDWRRWLIAAGIFHVIFAFFFTTVFTNIAGLGTGMIHSLGYWLEQQGVRRGSQPQYYYMLIIMPMYEFLPIIGSIGAMFAGSTLFWRWRRRDNLEKARLNQMERDLINVEMNGPADADPDESELAALTAQREKQERELDRAHRAYFEAHRLTELPFLLLWAWLAVLNLVGYSLAGEKMPWLGTHLTLPMIFLTAWFFGRIVTNLDARKFFERGSWLYLILFPLMLLTTAQVIGPVLIGRGPFQGLTQPQLAQTYNWLAALVVLGVTLFVINRLRRATGWLQLWRTFGVAVLLVLSVMTFRSAWLASFINYDHPTEFLVYAHSAGAVKTVLDQIEEISLRTTDGYDLRFAYDNEVSWPYSWYFRDYPNAVFVGANPTISNLEDTVAVVVGDDNRSKVEPILEDRYMRFDHNRLWWPMQDYFYLTAARVNDLFDFSPDNLQAAQVREGIFDIWWSRDYSTYADALNKDLSLTNWPVADRMHFYVRKDIAAQVWDYGIGEGGVANPLDDLPVNQCNANWLTPQPITVIENPADPMSRPLGLDVTDEGLIYVAEEYGHRISVFDAAGNFLRHIGQQGSGVGGAQPQFTRPNSVNLASDGSLVVADTWNYRVQQLAPQGDVIDVWGQPGEFGFEAPVDPTDALWGPRDALAIGGRVYVADTGNKRVRVYDITGPDPIHIMDIGEGGSLAGQLDEPSSVAVHTDGRVYVADTWNRRVSVFTTGGDFVTAIDVRGWYEELGNRPYLAIDEERDYLYVTDPDAGRVLVYDTDGNCLGSFGQAAGDTVQPGQFDVIGGVDVGPEGRVYVTNASEGWIQVFEPFPTPDEIGEMDTGGAMSQDGEPMMGFSELEFGEPETTPELEASE